MGINFGTEYKRFKREMEQKPMLSKVQTKSANYLCIVAVLKALRERGYINDKEYARAKKYYRKLTGADIVIAD